MIHQRLANMFPRTSKVRRDRYSLGQKIFSVFGEAFDNEYSNNVRLKDTSTLLNDLFVCGTLYQIQLEEEDFIVLNDTKSTSVEWFYPSLIGLHDFLGSLELNRLDTLEDLLIPTIDHLLPGEIHILDTNIIYDSNIGLISNISIPNRLIIEVKDS